MDIRKSGSQSSAKGPEQNFTGNVRIDPLMQAPEPSRNSCALVTFEPGARSHGTGTRSDKHSSSLKAAVGCRARAVRRWRFELATLSGVLRVRSTGTAARQRQPCRTLRYRSHSTARTWNGWRRSATRFTRRESYADRFAPTRVTTPSLARL